MRNRDRDVSQTSRHHGCREKLSGDEYECMKMKCLSQYGDSAGTQVTEECSATPTLGG